MSFSTLAPAAIFTKFRMNVMTFDPNVTVFQECICFLTVDFYFVKVASTACCHVPTEKENTGSEYKESFWTNLFKFKKNREGYCFVYTLSTFFYSDEVLRNRNSSAGCPINLLPKAVLEF
jgi:hypothetical protein